MPSMKLSDYSSLFKALSEPVRLRILCLLLEKGELCVCDLVQGLALSQSVVSRHLAYLRNNDLLLARREGVWMYYQVNHGAEYVSGLLRQFHQNAGQSLEFADDLQRLAALDCDSCH